MDNIMRFAVFLLVAIIISDFQIGKGIIKEDLLFFILVLEIIENL